MKLMIDGLEALPQVAEKIIGAADVCSTIVFRGEIGAGKTTLIKEICALLGVKDHVVSPTFGLVNTYQGTEGAVHHFDWYRIKHEEEAIEIGWEDYLDRGDWLLVEWPEKIESLLPEEFIDVHLQVETDGRRKLTMRKIR